MKSLIVERPHGFLIWKSKQTSIVNDAPLPIDEKLGLWCDGEIYGEIILDKPEELTDLSEIDSHRMRDYEIKLKWPDVEKFYLHKIKNFEAYDEMIPAQIDNDDEIVLDNIIEPNESQKEILDIAETLPNQILIDKEYVQLTDNKQMINGESIRDLLAAAFDDVKDLESESDYILPLYQLALVRSPVLRFKKQDGEEMPYEIIERGDEYCVIKTDTNEVEECYDNESDAQDLLTALRINVEEDEESKTLDESDSEITDEKPPESEKVGRRLRGGMLKRLRESFDTLKEIISWAEKEDEEMPVLEGFSGFGIKESKDGPIFYTYATNAFEDREGELFSTKALQNFVDENSDNEIKGYFNLFHMQGTDFAEKRFQAVIGRMLLEAGPFLKSDVAKQIKKFLKKYPKSHPELAPEGWGASIEYKYLPEQRMTGIYDWLWITKTSLLPRAMAANINTIGALKMDTKELNPAQIELGKEMLGADLFNKLVEDGEIKTAKLEEELNFKDNEEDESNDEQVENPDDEQTEVEAESESTDEESNEEVETESIDEESVEEESVETPDVVEVVENVVGKMFEGIKSELEIIATFPEAIKKLNERMDSFEQKAVKQMELPRASLFDYVKQLSVSESDGEKMSDDEKKKKGPKETPKNKDDNSYGAPYFNRS